MELENNEISYLTQQEQTDVESLAETSLTFDNSSITRFPSSTSETEYDFNAVDDDVREFFESQFPSGKEKVTVKEKGVQEWLNTTGDETLDVGSFDSQSNQNFGDSFATEDVEKISAIILDAVKNIVYIPSAWAEMEVEQEVPSGDFKSNFIKEAKERPILTLMNCIHLYCNESINTSERLQAYIDILECATRSVEKLDIPITKERKPADINTLKNFQQGDYFSDIRLKFSKLPRSKRPLVKAVEKFVSTDIIGAAERNSAILFTRFTSIPDVVKQCNDEQHLNFSPDQLAKIGIILQRAVHQEIFSRCLDFLKHLGFSLVANEDEDEYRINLSSNESCFNMSQGQSSQCSQNDGIDSLSSRSSQNSDRTNSSQNSNASAMADSDYDDMNSPGFIEHLRGHFQADHGDSPGNSQRSWSSYESQSPLQLSIPEREPERATDFAINEVAPLPQLEELGYVIVNTRDWIPENFMDNSQDNSENENEEPQRRRRRLE